MEHVACDLCGSLEQTDFAQPADYLLERPDVTARLVRCVRCGLVYQSPRPTLEEIGVHYPASYDSYGDYRVETPNGLLRMAFDYGMRKRTRYVTRSVPGGRLLDVGCAAGVFLVSMRELGGWEVEGVELNAGAAGHARATYGLTVHTGTLEEAHLPDAHFDVVTLFDVLEHLHSPIAALREVHRILRPGGILVLRLPNLDSWDARLFGDAWAGLDAPRHLYIYSPRTLAATLKQAGFAVEGWDTSIGAYPVFALSTRFAMEQRRFAPAIRRRVLGLLNHPVTRLATAPVFAVPSLFRHGPVLVMTGRRSS